MRQKLNVLLEVHSVCYLSNVFLILFINVLLLFKVGLPIFSIDKSIRKFTNIVQNLQSLTSLDKCKLKID